MRTGIVILVAALGAATACKNKDQGKAGGGSGSAGSAAAAPPGTPGKPVDQATLADIAAMKFGEAKVTVMKSSPGTVQLKIQHTNVDPAMTAQVDVGPCVNCVPMDLPQWQAHAKEMRELEDPNIRDKEDTVFEVGEAMAGSHKTIYTHTIGFDVKLGDTMTAAHNYTLYWNDGVNQVRVKTWDASVPNSADIKALAAKVPKEKLAALAAETFQYVVPKVQGAK